MKTSELIEYPYICPITKRSFKSAVALSVYITKTLKINHKEYYDTYIKNIVKCNFCENDGRFISIAKGYGNLCNNKECISKSRQTNTIEGIMYIHDCDFETANKLLIDKNKAISDTCKKTSIKKTIDNPNYLKENSSWCKEFWIKKGYTEEEAQLKLKDIQTNNGNKLKLKLLSDDIFREKLKIKNSTNIKYWLNKGFSLIEAYIKLKERQTTFSKDICIKKYGEIDGLKHWKERQEKWLNTLDSKTEEEKIEINRKKLMNNSGYSKISQELFWIIYNNFKEHNIVFQELSNREVIMYNHDIKKMYKYDFVDFTNKKIIEFNGDFWHCNPLLYNEKYFNNIKQKNAQELWDADNIKINFAKKKGYDILVVWEYDFKNDKDKIIKDCINFLKN